MEENTLADSISVGVPRNADKAISAIIESKGLTVEVTDDEILEAMRITGRECGVFGEPAGVTGMAGLEKLCREGKIPADASVAVIVTGNGLKDTANGIKAAGEPIRLEPDLVKFKEVYEQPK
jgi:threonine synthase